VDTDLVQHIGNFVTIASLILGIVAVFSSFALLRRPRKAYPQEISSPRIALTNNSTNTSKKQNVHLIFVAQMDDCIKERQVTLPISVVEHLVHVERQRITQSRETRSAQVNGKTGRMIAVMERKATGSTCDMETAEELETLLERIDTWLRGVAPSISSTSPGGTSATPSPGGKRARATS
jgi:hypothetical protein